MHRQDWADSDCYRMLFGVGTVHSETSVAACKCLATVTREQCGEGPNFTYSKFSPLCRVPQLLMNLRRSITTLDICGEWGGDREATLEMSLGDVYVQGRAPQKRLSALQVCHRSDRPLPDAAQAVGPRLQMTS